LATRELHFAREEWLMKIGCRLAALTFGPRTTQRMFTIKVRLGAGTLHLAKYLIRVAVYILVAKVWFFFEMAMSSYYSSTGEMPDRSRA
jgi:hypothetical protein